MLKEGDEGWREQTGAGYDGAGDRGDIGQGSEGNCAGNAGENTESCGTKAVGQCDGKCRDKAKVIDWVFFSLLLAIYTGVLFYLFYQQTLAPEGVYYSDMKAYILEMQGLDSGYSFPYPILFKLGALFFFFLHKPALCMALATTFLNSLSPLALKWFFNRRLLTSCGNQEGRGLATGLLISIATFALLFVSMVYPPEGIYLPGIPNKYLGVFTPNPFHNATYLAARPFAIVTFFLFAGILPEYEKKTDWKLFGFFGLFLLLATLAKPSFTLVLVSTAGLIMLIRLFREKFHNFVPTIKLGICFIPTFVALLYQYGGVFVSEGEEESGIGFGVATVWRLYSNNIPLAIGLALGFPILVLLLNRKELKQNSLYRFSWQFWVVSLAEVLILYEKGFRMPDMNFGWGYMYGLFFAFVGAMEVLLRRTLRKEGRWQITALQWLAFSWHLVCGLYYFYGIFNGGFYY